MHSSILQASERLPVSKFHNMSIGIAHHRKVSHDTAYVHRWLNQNVLLTCLLGDSINFFPTVALKPEVIQAGLHFVLDYDQHEDRILPQRSCWAEPDIVTTLKPAIADNRKTAERGIEVD